MQIRIDPARSLSGTILVPGDKSISHRALLFAALAKGETQIENLLESADVLSTWKCLEQLGITISKEKMGKVTVRGRQQFAIPQSALNCGNSGTTLRLLMGILSAKSTPAQLIGDESLSRRPMKRISQPLIQMGAKISLAQEEYAPVQILNRSPLRGAEYALPVASAQLKSSLILAALFAEGKTVLGGKIVSRDHTERLLPSFGASLEQDSTTISLRGPQTLSPCHVLVPGDFSSAAFWIAAGLIIPNSTIEILRVSLNPTRIGLLNILLRMGAKIETEIETTSPEPIGRLLVRTSQLSGTEVLAHEIPSLIDEVPLLAILACHAKGITRVQGAQELRVKETDRIAAIAKNLRSMGAKIETFDDGFEIHGPQRLKGCTLDSFHDHRIAMGFAIAGLAAEGPTVISGSEATQISYPNFFETMDKLLRL